jgi:ElaA protein
MSTNHTIQWVTKAFSDLSNIELYAMLRLRSEVFVVEQNCVYLDIDNNDPKAHHTLGWIDHELAATTRLFDKNIMYDNYQSIGRVLTSQKYRRTGAGKELMNYSIKECERLFGKGPIKIGAQFYLKKFYSELGFEQNGEIYLEDGIEHIPMIRTAQ